MMYEPFRAPTQAPVRESPIRESVRRALAEVRAAEASAWRRRPGAAPDDAETWPSPELQRRLAALRRDLTQFVGRARAAGVPPERLLPLVASLVREGDPPADAADGDDLMTKVARWSIEAYYDEPELRGAPRFF